MKQIMLVFSIVVVALLPIWPYSQQWGYASSAWVCLLGVIILALHLLKAI